jgi:hypothetical protein
MHAAQARSEMVKCGWEETLRGADLAIAMYFPSAIKHGNGKFSIRKFQLKVED